MLLYGCLYIGVDGPLIQYLTTFKKFSLGAELQPLQASPAMSFPQACRFLEVGQGGGWGCGPEQLGATVPCTRVSLDVSQWRGAHSFWPCFVNILEHSGCSGGSPEAPYLNNVILYIDIYIIQHILSRPKADFCCFFHFHINLK